MNAPKNRGQGNNQPAGNSDLNIPTLGSGPIVQPGEDPAAIAALGQQQAAPSLSDFAKDDDEAASSSADSPGLQPLVDPGPVSGAPIAREMSREEMQEVLQNIVQQQAQMATMLSALARNNPVFSRGDRDQFSEVPKQTLEMPIEGDLSRMRRPDQRVEGVDIDVIAHMDHAQQLAFLEEYVVINIHESSEKGAENPVPLWINGRGVAIVRGEDMAVRRKYVEMLLRAKPEGIETRITRDGNGNVKNHIDKTRSLKYPFSIVLDRNPRGPAWARKIRSEA